MLILPLHRPLTRATFPFVTALLILVNVFVFFGLQLEDADVMPRAIEQYVDSGLPAIEEPAYERWLERGGREADLAELRELPDGMEGLYLAHVTPYDHGFVQAMRDGTLLDDAKARDEWSRLRAGFDAIVAEDFTQRHVLRSSEIDPWLMFSSAFLHGGVMHLVGNMLFLAALGLLVEGALGGWRFLGVYVLGALGASAASLAWRWGEAGGGLGASGAIAALMGAFCVLWGRRPVRFFYWIFVVFDYVRAPAIWLLPVWLGWEIFQMFAYPDAGVGFDAHAGGLVSGALLGALLVHLGQTRAEFLREDEPDAVDHRWADAQAHLGRMQLADADRLLEALQAEQPARFDVALARYRVAANARNPAMRAARALDLLQLPAPDRAAVDAQAEAFEHAALPAASRATLLRRWLALGAADAMEARLHAAQPSDEDAALWFELALRRRESHDAAGAQRALQAVRDRFPASPQARKAEFLLAQPA